MPCSLVGYVMGLAGMDAGTVLAGNSRTAQALWSFYYGHTHFSPLSAGKSGN